MTLQDMIRWVELRTIDVVAQELLDQKLELDAYRRKFTMHEFDKKTNSIVFKSDASVEGGETVNYERIPAPMEADSTVPVPADWRLMTVKLQIKDKK